MNSGFVVVPTIVPNSRHEFEGEQAQEFSITCSARGKPDPKYDFYKVISFFALFCLQYNIHIHMLKKLVCCHPNLQHEIRAVD